MQDFTPQFPRSISGGRFRPPLTHEGIEALGSRVDRAYCQFPLTDTERACLIKAYGNLKIVDRSIAANHVGMSLPTLNALPPEPWRGDGTRGEIISHNVFYCERVRAFIEAVERKYLRLPTSPLRAGDGSRAH